MSDSGEGTDERKVVELSQPAAEEEESYDEEDLSNHPMFCILNTLLTDEEGNNVAEHLGALTRAVQANTKMMGRLLKELASPRK